MKLRYLAIAALAIAALTAGCGGTSSTGKLPETPGRTYSPAVQHNFTAACTAQGTSATTCECLLNKVETHESEEQLLAIEAAMKANVPAPAALTELEHECSGE